jgi:hypothetical protein
MTIRQVILPAHFSVALHETPQTENLAISAWEDVAVSIQELTATLLEQLEDDTNTADKPYLARELITTAVETIEILGSALLRFRNHKLRQFHYAGNDELATLFAGVARGILEEEALSFLRLPRPTVDDSLVVAALGRISGRAQTCLIDFAEYWQEKIPMVRWFRHYPACLTWDQPALIDTSDNPKLQIVHAAIVERLPQLLEVIVHPDERSFEYEELKPEDGRIARGITRVAIQLLYMVSANQVLDQTSSDPADRLPKVYPALTHDLSDAQRGALSSWGGYFLVPRA